MNHPLHDRCRLVGAVWFQRTSTNTSSMYMCISACAALVNPSHTERGTTVEQMPADTEKQNVPNQIGAIGACWQPVGNLSMPKVCWDVHRAWRAHVRLEGLGHRANFPERPFFSWLQANKQTSQKTQMPSHHFLIWRVVLPVSIFLGRGPFSSFSV